MQSQAVISQRPTPRTRCPRTSGSGKGKPRVVQLRSGTAEQRVRQAIAEQPGISNRALARRANVSDSTASKWAHIVRQEQAQQVAQ